MARPLRIDGSLSLTAVGYRDPMVGVMRAGVRAFRRGEGENRVRLSGVRARSGALEWPLPGVPGLEHARRRSSARRRRRARTGCTAAYGRRAGRRRPCSAAPPRRDRRQRLRPAAGRIEEFGRVLGGGIVRGSLVLIGGDPGVGKSTLLARSATRSRSGTAGPLHLRRGVAGADRCGTPAGLDARTCCSPATPTSDHPRTIENSRRAWSWSTQSRSTAPTSSRRREREPASGVHAAPDAACEGHWRQRLLDRPRHQGGALAGPKMLEHMVDTVLYLEGERYHTYRLLRGTRTASGRRTRSACSRCAARGWSRWRTLRRRSCRSAARARRIVGAVTMEGTRPLLVESRRIASRSSLAVPRRAANGIENNRLLLVSAYSAGGSGCRSTTRPVRQRDRRPPIDEPAADWRWRCRRVELPRSAGRPASGGAGEIGLSGELRSVGQLEIRLREAAKLGFERAVVPRSTASAI